MRLEAGKKYVLRNGGHAECVAVWSRPDCYDYGATCIFLDGRLQGESSNYPLDGACGASLMNPLPRDFDIVGEWGEVTE